MGLRSNLLHKLKCFATDALYGKPDFSLKKGDTVVSKLSPEKLFIVDINWALSAVAVKPYGTGSVRIVPAANVVKISG